ncbi:MAG: ribbon-helix-helix domain-containing protein [Candidatus Diapherotrites archaeon]|nr:ribbon-helix-helix domain-containing protein [Candidatus Diapherotrites archaeon]
METVIVQARLPNGLVKQVDSLVSGGHYLNKSEAVRDALRKLVLEKQVGSIPNTGNSVKEVREMRKKLSKKKISLKELNSLY